MPVDQLLDTSFMIPHLSSCHPTTPWHHHLAHLTDLMSFRSGVWRFPSTPWQINAVWIQSLRHTSPIQRSSTQRCLFHPSTPPLIILPFFVIICIHPCHFYKCSHPAIRHCKQGLFLMIVSGGHTGLPTAWASGLKCFGPWIELMCCACLLLRTEYCVQGQKLKSNVW